jgi:hypothetical protein
MPSRKRKLSSTEDTIVYKGVSKIRRKTYQARIYVNKRNVFLGNFGTARRAAIEYDRAIIKYNKSKDRLNWPGGLPEMDQMEKKRRLHLRNTSGYRGAFRSGKRFYARVTVNKKYVRLGTFDTIKEAAIAHDQAIIKYNLPKEKLNWPDGLPETNPETNVKMNPETNATTNANTNANTIANTNPKVNVKTNVKADTKTNIKTNVKTNTKTDTKTNPKTNPKTNTKTNPKSNPKTNTKTNTKAKAKAKANLKPKIRSAKKARSCTGYRGVYKNGKNFQAQINLDGKITYLGTFDSPKEAALAYDRALISELNFPNSVTVIEEEKDCVLRQAAVTIAMLK